jgi:hypothetical protein
MAKTNYLSNGEIKVQKTIFKGYPQNNQNFLTLGMYVMEKPSCRFITAPVMNKVYLIDCKTYIYTCMLINYYYYVLL